MKLFQERLPLHCPRAGWAPARGRGQACGPNPTPPASPRPDPPPPPASARASLPRGRADPQPPVRGPDTHSRSRSAAAAPSVPGHDWKLGLPGAHFRVPSRQLGGLLSIAGSAGAAGELGPEPRWDGASFGVCPYPRRH